MIVYFGETGFEIFRIGFDVGWIMDFPDLYSGIEGYHHVLVSVHRIRAEQFARNMDELCVM